MTTMNESKADYHLLPTAEGQRVSHSMAYPGQTRPLIPLAGPPPDHILVRTLGNALQALPKQQVEQPDTILVSVPPGSAPGSSLMVHTADGQVLSVTIPEGVFPGHCFLVGLPQATLVVANDLELAVEPSKPLVAAQLL